MNNYRMTINAEIGPVTKMVVEFKADSGREATTWCRKFIKTKLRLDLEDRDWDLDEFAPGLSGKVFRG